MIVTFSTIDNQPGSCDTLNTQEKPKGMQSRALVHAMLCLILGASALPKGAQASEQKLPTQPPAGVQHEPGLVYSRGVSGDLKLDLALPARGHGPVPAIVVLHGGAWRELCGTRHTLLPITFELAARGYVAVTISYRSAPMHPFPAQIHDAKCAVRWLRANAARYRIDTERIGVLGHSSGAHLACLLGTTAGRADFEGTGGHAAQSSAVQAVVGYYGATDLAQLHARAGGNGPKDWFTRVVLEDLLGGPPAKKAECYAKASPLSHLHKAAAPTLLIHGSADSIVPLDQSERYVERARAVKAPVRLLVLKGADHGFGSGLGGKVGRQADVAALDFLDRHLKSVRK
jgi:acetyl esterase/lipase